MTAVNETVVREYFEMLGFLVSQPRKYTVPGRQKSAEEEVDLVVYNPQIKDRKTPSSFVWSGVDLKLIDRAVVGIRGWHTERFYASRVEQTPDILRFVEPESIKFAGRIMGGDDMLRVLCLPRLPASGELRAKSITMLKERGVDGILSFETILRELAASVETNRNYEKSDILQVIRLMKCYNLIKDDQMELFSGRRHVVGASKRR